ncbi:MAG: glycyl-radical enzyme activating protein [Omnitrophica WOR_2 bacterium]
MSGTIFNIQRFSIHDGPGIRTTVFLKGCNLRCFWCHNPESALMQPQIQFFPGKCIACGSCVDICQHGAQQLEGGRRVYDRSLCQECGDCLVNCFSGALQWVGKEASVEQVLAEIEQDRLYYENSRGGVTFSGGEPLLQKEFLRSLLAESKKRGFHTAVDTAGNVPWESFEAIKPYTDLFLYDFKALDERKHREATGVGNRRILDNLQRLADGDVEIWIRIPVIPGVNDREKDIQAMAAFLSPLKGIRWVELLSFHHLGSEKYESLGKPYPSKELKPPSDAHMAELSAIFQEQGLCARKM